MPWDGEGAGTSRIPGITGTLRRQIVILIFSFSSNGVWVGSGAQAPKEQGRRAWKD